MAEASLRAHVLRTLRHTPGVRVWGWPASAFTGAGHPDLFGLAFGRFYALELKTRTGRATQRQQIAIRDIRKAGGYAWIVRTVPQAEQALAWIIGGKHPPMAEEPLNLDDWFKDLDMNKAPESVAANEDVSLPWDDIEPEPKLLGVAPMPEQSPEMPSLDLATGTATHEETLTALDARDDALNVKAESGRKRVPRVTKPTVDDLQDARDAGLLGADAPEPIAQSEVNDFIALVRRIDDDVRASGDRTTMVYEELHNLRLELNVTRQCVQALEKVIRELVVLISEEEPEIVPSLVDAPRVDPVTTPEPPRRSTRRRAS